MRAWVWLSHTMACLLLLTTCVVHANEAFTVTFGQDKEAKTIGDLKPRVIPYDKKTAPDVSIQYVMKRYRKLFEKATTPAVRIEALNRLNNLSASYGIIEKDLIIDPYVEAEVILDTFQHITDTGDEYQRMDELLYLTAKATFFTGETLESIKRLELLIGLYADSEYAEEALFRLAEMHFELADFKTARTYYERLLKRTKAPVMRRFGLYKLAWTQFRLDDRDGTFATLAKLVEGYPDASNVDRSYGIAAIEEPTQAYKGFDLPSDTRIFPDAMRLFAINSLQASGNVKVASLAKQLGGSQFENLSLIALTQHLELKERGLAAARITQDYISEKPPSLNMFPHAVYVIDTLLAHSGTVAAWKQKALLVEHYGVRSQLWETSSKEQKSSLLGKIKTTTQELAHLNYVRMQERKTKDQLLVKHASASADYYLQLAELETATPEADEDRYLAAQAYDRAERFKDAIELYERLSYIEIVDQGETTMKARTSFNKAPAAAYKALLAHRALDKKERGDATWSPRRIQATQQFLLAQGTHPEAPVVAQNLADYFIQSSEPGKAIKALSLFETLATATAQQKFSSHQQRAQLYYNIGDYMHSELHYRSALAALSSLETQDTALMPKLKDGVANSIFQLAETSESGTEATSHYMRLADEFQDHPLASAALFNAGEHYHSSSLWAESINVHERYIVQYPEDPLGIDARKKLITAFQQTDQLGLAAFNLMQLAESTLGSDPKTASSSSYQAALYYKDLNQTGDALNAFNWFIQSEPSDPTLLGEALYFFFAQSKGSDDQFASASRLLAHIDQHDLDDARSATIGSEAALVLAKARQAEFETLAITLPFADSIKAKTAKLDACTKAYKQVMDFGVAEYLSAAKYNMAYIYQSLAHDIMNSERPPGLSELELEQYEILLEEQAIPIEEEAIALHESNIEYSEGRELNEWVVQSFTALATLNPSLYKRPILGPNYAEDIH